ncbi:MAG: thioredoxin-disulfide reductase [Lachnospiraceae bacterium]|jgi:thioredoxin reductase (NADPH)|nr:thioredoxin-disulfide reductase [Lachnospiraceae bacterium]
MQHIYDTAIIGGGPAGYTAALYASRAGLDTVILEKKFAGGQMALTGEIDNYPGFEDGIGGPALAIKMQQGAERFGAKTKNTEVTAVDFSKAVKRAVTATGDILSKTVILSTGAAPKELGIEKEQELVGKGIHYCAHCDGRFYQGKTVLVVGGGNSAASDALYLSLLAKKVYVVHRRDTLRATKVYREPLMRAGNIEFLWDSIVSGFLTDGRIVGASIKNLHTGVIHPVACDGIFASIGRKPDTGFLQGALPLDAHGYIPADESTKTTVKGVFAAGDVRTKALRQIVTAVADGAAAAHFAEEYLAGNFP